MTTISQYMQATIMASFYITNQLIQTHMYPRWKVRLYVDIHIFNSELYLESLKCIHKCDVEIRPISLPTEQCDAYWFTSLRFILPALDKTLNAFRLLDVHYYWTKTDVKTIVEVLANWEASNKRCCAWKYHCPNNTRPYCAALFGLNLSKDSLGVDLSIDMDFLISQLRLMFSTRITDDLSTIIYGDDEWLLYLLLMFYFRNSYGGIDGSKVYHLSEREHEYIILYKRYHSIQPEKWYHRYTKVIKYIESREDPHMLEDGKALKSLYR
jgi:hypothetical protein